MKKIILIIILLSHHINSFSQQKAYEKLKALKIAHITEKLNLTEKESQVFWPIYNENEKHRHEIRASKKAKLKLLDINMLSEAEAEMHLKNLINLEEKKHQYEKEYLNKLVKILPHKKILLLKHNDHSFRRKVLHEYKNRHKGLKKK